MGVGFFIPQNEKESVEDGSGTDVFRLGVEDK
jgi:hypothetical protein